MRFHIGSITKTFTASAVLQLIDDCRLGLDDTIERFQPGLDYAGQVTVRQLLQHTSGIPDFQEVAEFQTALYGTPFRIWEPQGPIDLVVDSPPAFMPGTGWLYSNTNYFILGLVIESVTGRSLEEVVDEAILRPLGLDATSVPHDAGDPPPATSGASLVLDDPDLTVVSITPSNYNPSVTWAAGSMISTLEGLERWARAVGTGELLSPTLQQQRLSLVPIPVPFVPLPAVPGPTASRRSPFLLLRRQRRCRARVPPRTRRPSRRRQRPPSLCQRRGLPSRLT